MAGPGSAGHDRKLEEVGRVMAILTAIGMACMAILKGVLKVVELIGCLFGRKRK